MFTLVLLSWFVAQWSFSRAATSVVGDGTKPEAKDSWGETQLIEDCTGDPVRAHSHHQHPPWAVRPCLLRSLEKTL